MEVFEEVYFASCLRHTDYILNENRISKRGIARDVLEGNSVFANRSFVGLGSLCCRINGISSCLVRNRLPLLANARFFLNARLAHRYGLLDIINCGRNFTCCLAYVNMHLTDACRSSLCFLSQLPYINAR